jgi:hypothetical protein
VRQCGSASKRPRGDHASVSPRLVVEASVEGVITSTCAAAPTDTDWSNPAHPNLRRKNLEWRPGRIADRLAIAQKHRHTAGKDSLGPGDPMCCYAWSISEGRNEWATAHLVWRTDRDNGSTTDQHARVGRGRLCQPAMCAGHYRPHMQHGSWHAQSPLQVVSRPPLTQATVNAPLFMSTVGPVSVRDAPCPF